ncbi:hypothetical protein ACEXOS_015105 [Herbiconiux sp. P16]|uniref:hypothetical protein n=1 Tax=Herbiconiux wuyangfengii TaxID=3342794 RepID=UPI0035B79BE8
MTGGDVATLVVGIFAVVVAGVSVIVALRANARASEANRLAVDANTAAAEANRIATQSLDAKKATLPPPWSAAVSTGKNTIGFTNQSSRHIVVTRVEVEPDEAAGLVHLARELPTRVEYGDAFELMVIRTMQVSPSEIHLTWHFDGESAEQVTRRFV